MQEKVEPTRPQMSEADRACKVAPSPFPSFGKLLELPVLNIGLAPQDDLEQHGLLSQVQVVVGMGTLDGLGLCALAQAFQPILPKGTIKRVLSTYLLSLMSFHHDGNFFGLFPHSLMK